MFFNGLGAEHQFIAELLVRFPLRNQSENVPFSPRESCQPPTDCVFPGPNLSALLWREKARAGRGLFDCYHVIIWGSVFHYDTYRSRLPRLGQHDIPI